MEKGGWKVNLFTCSTAANKEQVESEEGRREKCHELSFVLLWKMPFLPSTRFSLSLSEFNEHLQIKPQVRCNDETMRMLQATFLKLFNQKVETLRFKTNTGAPVGINKSWNGGFGWCRSR